MIKPKDMLKKLPLDSPKQTSCGQVALGGIAMASTWMACLVTGVQMQLSTSLSPTVKGLGFSVLGSRVLEFRV